MMNKRYLLGGIAAVAVAGLLSVALKGSEAKAYEKFKYGGVEYTIVEEPKGDEAGALVVSGGDGENVRGTQTVNIYHNIEHDGKKYATIRIEEGAFANNKKIEKVAISWSAGYIDAIPANCFKNCTNLRSVQLGSVHLHGIGKNAFYGCKRLKNLCINSKELKKYRVARDCFDGVGNLNVYVRSGKKYADWIESKGGAGSCKKISITKWAGFPD